MPSGRKPVSTQSSVLVNRSGELMLAVTGLAVDHRNAVGLGGRTESSGEPASEPHQVRVVQPLIAVGVPTPPPHPEAAR